MDWTPIAAFTAAVLSAVSAWQSRRAAREAARIGARRSILNSDFKELCRLIYSVIAYSKRALDAKDEHRFDEQINKANDSAKQLNEIRIQHRITLEPIFEAIWQLNSVPIMIAQFRNNRSDKRALEIIKCGTNLRVLIDRIVSIIFFEGCKPGWWLRWRLRCTMRTLKRTFNNHAGAR